MIIHLSDPVKNKYTSRYYTSSFETHNSSIFVFGADATLHELIRQYLCNSQDGLSRSSIRNLYKDVPGHYALVGIDGNKTTAVTDPYGIIKLYLFDRGEGKIICDDANELKNERFKLDHQPIKFFFICNYTPSRHTFFKELSKLEPCSIYSFESGRLTDRAIYAELGNEPVEGETFLHRFHDVMVSSLAFCREHYPESNLFLSGGVDSSFLYSLLCSKNHQDWAGLSVGQLGGLKQNHKIDNDYDIEYSTRLAASHGQSVKVREYDISGSEVLKDFITLRDTLFTEYAPALGYMGWMRSVNPEKLIVNGQNADSVLSFGSQGFPRIRNWKLTGLNGLFSRYFYFFGSGARFSPLRAIAVLLRAVYYRKNYPELKFVFSERNYFLGIGLHPENRYFNELDPVFYGISRPEELAEWFEHEYLRHLLEEYGHLGSHALSLLLYNKTYMQGSANRATVLSALVQDRKIVLPYASLPLLELMCCLQPDWHYAFYGKYPNLAVGKQKIDLPDYIMKRSDPNDCDCTTLLYTALLKNDGFHGFIKQILQNTHWERYLGILNPSMVKKLQSLNKDILQQDLPIVMRFVWLESILQKFRVE